MAVLTCMCGKVLTDENVCPLPRGQVCTGQHVPPRAHSGGTVPEPDETGAPEEIEW